MGPLLGFHIFLSIYIVHIFVEVSVRWSYFMDLCFCTNPATATLTLMLMTLFTIIIYIVMFYVLCTSINRDLSSQGLYFPLTLINVVLRYSNNNIFMK